MKKGAFSLLELLISMALMIIMYTMLMSPASKSWQATQKAACQKNLQSLYVSLKIYAMENHDTLPIANEAATSEIPLSLLVPKYTSATEVFVCSGSGDAAREAMKPQGSSNLDPSQYSKANTKAVFADVMNELNRNRTGGLVYDDRSRYSVTLKRSFGTEAEAWNGEVVGPTAIFPNKTVDLLVAGNQLVAFDKNNRKLWETTLAYPLNPATQDSPPCLESGKTLYFYDQGVLTAFDLSSGAVRWRLPSVGVSKVQLDDQGMLYVTTTAAGHESIKYSQQIDPGQDHSTVILKVDPSSGKILWKAPKNGDNFFLSGKYLYLVRAQSCRWDAMAAILNESANSPRGSRMAVHFRIFRLNPNSGKLLWEYYRPEEPEMLDFQDNNILLLYPKEMQVLKFLGI